MIDSRVWLITGCDSGMGHEIARAALAARETVAICALQPSNVEDLIAAYPATATAHKLDVTDAAAITAITADIEHRLGRIDVLVNNAGYGAVGPVEQTGPEVYRPMFDVNFFGTAELIRATVPGMRQRRSGHIINLSSAGGYCASPGFGFYAATKFAIEGLSEALRKELEPFGVKVTLIEPGSIRTRFAGGALHRPGALIDDYENTPTDATLKLMTDRDGNQPGDPAKVADAIVTMTRHPNPPLRLPMGTDSYLRLTEAVARQAEEFTQWSELARSVDFPEK